MIRVNAVSLSCQFLGFRDFAGGPAPTQSAPQTLSNSTQQEKNCNYFRIENSVDNFRRKYEN